MGCRDDGPSGPPDVMREEMETGRNGSNPGGALSVSPALRTQVAPNPNQAAAERVGRFLEAWEMHPSRGDIVYGLGVLKEDAPRDLLASDLRLLLSERQAVTDVLKGIDWKDQA